MKTITQIIHTLASITASAFLTEPRSKAPVFANSASGTHEGPVTRLADAAISESYCLVEIGSDAEHVALCNNAADIPLGIAIDEAEADGDPIAIAILGASSGTLQVRTGANVSAGNFLVTNTSGKAIPLPATAGSYYIVGRALHAANSGELVEFAPGLPTLRVVS